MTVRFCSRYHFGHRTHKKTHILYSMHLTATLNCFEKNTQALLIVIRDNLGATQHSLGDFHAALGESYQHALLLICLEKNKNALLTVLMALHKLYLLFGDLERVTESAKLAAAASPD